MPNVTATPLACKGGKLCAFVNNDDDAAVTVTVDISVCAENHSQSVTIPAHDAVEVCVTPTVTGTCAATISVGGAELSRRVVRLPCP